MHTRRNMIEHCRAGATATINAQIRGRKCSGRMRKSGICRQMSCGRHIQLSQPVAVVDWGFELLRSMCLSLLRFQGVDVRLMDARCISTIKLNYLHCIHNHYYPKPAPRGSIKMRVSLTADIWFIAIFWPWFARLLALVLLQTCSMYVNLAAVVHVA